MVSNKFLGSVAVHLGLHRHLNKYSTSLTGQISSYAEETLMAESEHGDAPDAWTLTSDPPKVGFIYNIYIRIMVLTTIIVSSGYG